MKSIERHSVVLFRSLDPTNLGKFWFGNYFQRASSSSGVRHVVSCLGNRYYVEDSNILDLANIVKPGTKVRVSNTPWVVKSCTKDSVRLINEKNVAEFSVPWNNLDVTNLGNTLFQADYEEQEKKKVDEELFDILIMLRFYKEESGEINIPADEAKTLIEKLTKRVNK